MLAANALSDSESYFDGAFVVGSGETAKAKHAWGEAVVWTRDGVVTRIIVNIHDNEQLAELPTQLKNLYGKPDASEVRHRVGSR